MSLGGVVDTVLDRSVVLGFSQIGLSVRSRLPGWPADPAPGALIGQDVAVTGATSGLGISTAVGVAALGARVHLVVRDEAKAKAVVARITAATPSAVVEVHRCDVGDLDDVRRFAGGVPRGRPPARRPRPQRRRDAARAHRVGAGARAVDGGARARTRC